MMKRSLARFSLALTVALLVAAAGHAQQKEAPHPLKGSFTYPSGTEAFRNDNLGPYISQKAGSYATWNQIAARGPLQLYILYPGTLRYVELDFGMLAPSSGSYPAGQVDCTVLGKGTPARVPVPAFLAGGDPYILNPTRSFRVTTGDEYTWQKTGTLNGEDVYDWVAGATLDLWDMPDGVRYIQAWITFTTAELQAINATAFLAFDSQTGVNPVGEVPSLLKVTRSGDTWTLAPMPAVGDIEPGRLNVASLTLQLTPVGTRKGYHSCPLGAYVMPFVLELTK